MGKIQLLKRAMGKQKARFSP